MSRKLSEFHNPLRTSLIWKIRTLIAYLNLKLILQNLFVPSIVKIFFLRIQGAKIGSRVFLASSIKIQFPWNLEIGTDCWIGEEVWFINHEKISIGSNVCISQRSVICSGSHDYRSASLEYSHKPIAIRDGAWICLDAKVLPGVTIGECSVVSAGEVVRKSLPDYSILIDGQVRPIDPPQ